MASKKVKYYVVWKGRQTGVFDNWETCKSYVDGFEKAQYKSFESKELAERAFKEKPEKHIYKGSSNKPTKEDRSSYASNIIYPSIAVDAACSGQSLKMEYQGVDPVSKDVIFHRGPYADGTNNVGEFLAIVHALSVLHKHKSNIPIYSDSKIAIGWVKKKKHASLLSPTANNRPIFELLERAEKWLRDHTYENKVLKWETKIWGENPADFGRK
ncbi:MAG: ribonuclease H [Chitinophagaceae bacterium]|nr:MAG: ribonuclease H [Chitinophagaceae bacterium]